MQPLHADIFTEPANVPADTLANLGPLRRLAGVWQADKGIDINPKAAGPERKLFREHVRMDPIDAQTNGPQLFFGLCYHIHINTPGEAITCLLVASCNDNNPFASKDKKTNDNATTQETREDGNKGGLFGRGGGKTGDNTTSNWTSDQRQQWRCPSRPLESQRGDAPSPYSQPARSD